MEGLSSRLEDKPDKEALEWIHDETSGRPQEPENPLHFQDSAEIGNFFLPLC